MKRGDKVVYIKLDPVWRDLLAIGKVCRVDSLYECPIRSLQVFVNGDRNTPYDANCFIPACSLAQVLWDGNR